jgi:hypothetical protein
MSNGFKLYAVIFNAVAKTENAVFTKITLINAM